MPRGNKGGKAANKTGKHKNRKNKHNIPKNGVKKNENGHSKDKVKCVRSSHVDPTVPMSREIGNLDEVVKQIERDEEEQRRSKKMPANVKWKETVKKVGMTKAQLCALREKEAHRNPPPQGKKLLHSSTNPSLSSDEEEEEAHSFSQEGSLDEEEDDDEEFTEDEVDEEEVRDDDSSEVETANDVESDEESDADYTDTANENPKDYRKGGYHPVNIGEVYNNRYRVVHKLGWGYFSTVWLVWDYQTQRFQAMKVQRSAKQYTAAAIDEIELLSQIKLAEEKSKTQHCTQLNDFFNHRGPNGLHVCMIFNVHGENLLLLIERYEYHGIPLPIVKCITQQVLIALDHIHSAGIIHTDLKPENVLLASPKHSIASLMSRYRPPPVHQRAPLTGKDIRLMTKSQRRRYFKKMAKLKGQGKLTKDDYHSTDMKEDASGKKGEEEEDVDERSGMVGEEQSDTEGSLTDEEFEVERFHHAVLADFGNSCWIDKQFSPDVQTRQYRCPEVILGEPYSTPIDIWSLACMVFELLTGDFLFDPKKGDNYSRDEDHLALFTELLGELPEKMRLGSGTNLRNYYDTKGELLHIKKLEFWDLKSLLHEKYCFKPHKAKEIAEFLLPMLEYDPDRRASAAHMLSDFSSFFDVDRDDYEPREARRRKKKWEDDEDEEDGEKDSESWSDAHSNSRSSRSCSDSRASAHSKEQSENVE